MCIIHVRRISFVIYRQTIFMKPGGILWETRSLKARNAEIRRRRRRPGRWSRLRIRSRIRSRDICVCKCNPSLRIFQYLWWRNRNDASVYRQGDFRNPTNLRSFKFGTIARPDEEASFNVPCDLADVYLFFSRREGVAVTNEPSIPRGARNIYLKKGARERGM